MNIFFMTIGSLNSIKEHGIYSDLLRKFREKEHKVYVVLPREKRTGGVTEVVVEDGITILYVRIGNITKCGFLEKGLSTLLISYQYKRAIQKELQGTNVDLLVYSTPPITLCDVIDYLKKKNKVFCYLLLKDIFPQNAIDLGILREKGLKGIVYRYFRKREKKLYKLSDKIGCMSQANCDYVIKHNPEVASRKVEICPNSIDILQYNLDEDDKLSIRKQYSIPTDKKVFIYGGNLGKPQNVPYIVECLKECDRIDSVFFLIIGSGSDRRYIDEYIEEDHPKHVMLFDHKNEVEYRRIVSCCDVGLVFLDNRFTIPNFPSRLLTYMEVGLPVLACTDINTDFGRTIDEGELGWWIESRSPNEFRDKVMQILQSDLSCYFDRVRQFLSKNYDVEQAYKTIMSSIEKNDG